MVPCVPGGGLLSSEASDARDYSVSLLDVIAVTLHYVLGLDTLGQLGHGTLCLKRCPVCLSGVSCGGNPVKPKSDRQLKGSASAGPSRCQTLSGHAEAGIM